MRKLFANDELLKSEYMRTKNRRIGEIGWRNFLLTETYE